MSAKSRRKGVRAEKEVAILMRAVFPDACRRTAGDEGRLEEVTGRDLDGTPGWCVQSQCSAAPRPLHKLQEAVRAAAPGEIPVAFVRQSSRSSSTPWAAVLPAAELVHLVRIYELFRRAYPGRLSELRLEDGLDPTRLP